MKSQNKVALSANDDKRIILPDRINTLAHTGSLERWTVNGAGILMMKMEVNRTGPFKCV